MCIFLSLFALSLLLLKSLPHTLRQNPKNHAKEIVLLMRFRGKDKMTGRMLMGIVSAKKVIDTYNGSELQHLLVVSLDWQAVLSFQLERRD